MLRLFLCLSLVLFIAQALSSCKEQRLDRQQILIESEQTLDSIPSGSGIAIQDSIVFIIGDDATSVYTFTLPSGPEKKIPITGLSNSLRREPKTVKHDLESAAIAQWQGTKYLMALGSGSNSTTRDSLLLLDVETYTNNHLYPLRNFYSYLQNITRTKSKQWNIEGATVHRNNLILCNRGNNLIISLAVDDFMKFIFGTATEKLQIEYHRIRMPKIGNREARISGVCTLNDEHLILCASVENTPDWTTDGPILGSIIAIYDIQQQKLVNYSILKDKAGRVMKEKIESVDVLSRDTDNSLSILAISDNDNGTSRLFRLKWQSKK